MQQGKVVRQYREPLSQTWKPDLVPQSEKGQNHCKRISRNSGSMHPLYPFRQSENRLIVCLNLKLLKNVLCGTFFYFPINFFTSEPRNLGSFMTTIRTWFHLHFLRLNMPASMSPSPSRTNHTHGGVKKITNKTPAAIKNTATKLILLGGLNCFQ
jgi:hypothetical protein